MALLDITRIPRRIARGNSAEVSAYTGPSGEIVVNTEEKRVHVQDGLTPGGVPMARASEVGMAFLAGTGDQYSRLQAYLDKIAGKGGYLDPGVIELAQTAIIRSGTELRVRGGGTAIIRASTSLAAGSPLMRNEHVSGTVNVFEDSDILLDGIVFDGNNNAGRTNSLVAFSKVDRLTLLRGAVRNNRYIGMSVAGCYHVTIDEAMSFYGCGKTEETPEGGAAVWMGIASDGTFNYDVTIGDSVRFFNNEWSALYLNNVNGATIGGQYRNNKESTIFANNTSSDLVFKALRIKGAVRKHISAQALELGARNVVIEGAILQDTDSSAIALTDCQDVMIADCILRNFGRDPVYYTQAAGVTVVTTGADGNQPKNISIKGGHILASDPNAYAAVDLGGGGTGAAMQGIAVEGVDVSGSTWSSGKPIVWGVGKRGANCITRGNLGAPDMHPKVLEVQANAATGAQSVTGVGFKPSRLEILATLSSSTALVQSNSVVGSNGTASCYSFASDGADGESTLRGNVAWSVVSVNGSVLAEATFTSFDDDGFTVNVTNVSGGRPWMRVVAHP
jgi:hypothetical protein